MSCGEMEDITSSIPEQFRDVAIFKNFSETGKTFFPLLTHDISEHVMLSCI